jgi:hypothetical protein
MDMELMIMTTSENPKMPTATAKEHRLRLFQATRRPSAIRDVEIKTQWGHIIMTGRLGQGHADLLDAICFHAERRTELNDGRIKLLVDPAKVRRACRIGGEQLKKLARELREATIQIKEPEHLSCIGGLVDHIDTAVRSDGTPITRRDPLTGGERELWRVELGKAFCRLVQKDVWVGYDPASLSYFTHGISQAVARHTLTHDQEPRGGWILDNLIRSVAGDIKSQAIRDRRREIIDDAPNFAKVGLAVLGDRVRRVQQAPGSPGSVEQTPGGRQTEKESVEQTPESVEQTPESVEQTPESVEQTPG